MNSGLILKSIPSPKTNIRTTENEELNQTWVDRDKPGIQINYELGMTQGYQINQSLSLRLRRCPPSLPDTPSCLIVVGGWLGWWVAHVILVTAPMPNPLIPFLDLTCAWTLDWDLASSLSIIADLAITTSFFSVWFVIYAAWAVLRCWLKRSLGIGNLFISSLIIEFYCLLTHN